MVSALTNSKKAFYRLESDLVGGGNFDDITDFDLVSSLDDFGGIVPLGTYDFATTLSTFLWIHSLQNNNGAFTQQEFTAQEIQRLKRLKTIKH